MRSKLIKVGVLGAALAIWSCQDQGPVDPTLDAFKTSGPSAAVIQNDYLPFTFDFEACGESLHMEGIDHWIVQLTETPSGQKMYGFRTNYKATTVGTTTGNIYKTIGQWHERWTWDDGDQAPYVYHIVTHMVLVGKGNTPNIQGRWIYQLTINANGDVVVDKWLGDDPTDGAEYRCING